MSWDCWIANEDGDDIGKVLLAGPYQPNPRPLPIYKIIGSDHPIIGSSAASGDIVLQRFGYDSGTLKIVLPRTTPDIFAGIDALFRRFASGRQPSVQFYNSVEVYLCAWVDYPRVEPTITRPERYRMEFELRILEVVEDPDP